MLHQFYTGSILTFEWYLMVTNGNADMFHITIDVSPSDTQCVHASKNSFLWLM